MTLYYQKQNTHHVDVEGAHVLFHVPSTSLFEIDQLDYDVLELLKNKGAVKPEDIQQRFLGAVDVQILKERIESYVDLKILDAEVYVPDGKPPVEINNFPLTTIVLNVNTGCNLACNYCYKEDLAKPSLGEKMAFETARKSIEMLVQESPGREQYNIVFFGGEPLSNMKLIRQVVDFADDFLAERNAKPDYTLTTNATLLNDELIQWFDEKRFGLTISIDGPQALHDKNRITIGGKGTYKVVAEKSKKLLSQYTSRPIGARVTLTSGVTDVVTIWDHLKNELGFQEVGVSPVTSGPIAPHNLDTEELFEVFDGMKRLGEHYVTEAIAGRNIGFSNMHQLMTDLWEGRSKTLPCGAGVGMLAVDHEGGLNLCHRFTGSEMPQFGTVETGIEKNALSGFIKKRADKSDKACNTCHIRNLCAGGCYHESYAHFSDPMKPTYHYCDLMRDWIDFGISAYSRILKENPEFFRIHIAPRRSFGK